MYRKSKKLLVWCLVVSMVLTQMLFTNMAFAATTNSGVDRYETSAKVALAGWTTSDYAVLAYGEDFPDALAAAPLAAAYKAPILLTNNDKLNTYTKDALTKLGVKNVIIVGGEGVVPKAVADEVAAMPGMTVLPRVAGTDRVGTALAIAKAVEAKTGKAAAEVFVVNSEAYADALSISSLAAMDPIATIVLVGKDDVSADVVSYVGSKKAYVIGGIGVVSDAVKAKFTTAERVTEGTDRYGTNLAVLKTFADFKFDNVFVATGENFPDALAGSVYAAKSNSPLVLVDQAITADTMALLKTKMTATSKVTTLGGLSTVASAASALETAVKPTTFGVESVTALNLNQIQVVFNQEVNKDSAESLANYVLDNGASGVNGLLSSAGIWNGTPVAKLQADKRTVIITLDNEANNTDDNKLRNQLPAKITVQDVLNVSEVKMTKYDGTVTFSDTTAPIVKGVTTLGNTVVVVEFSEPIQTTGAINGVTDNANYKLNGNALGSYGVSSITFDNTSNKATITFNNALADGDYTLTVSKDSNLVDLAGLRVLQNDVTFKMASDTNAGSISKVELGPDNTYVDILFTKPLAANYTLSLIPLRISAADGTNVDVFGDATITKAVVDGKLRLTNAGGSVTYTSITGTGTHAVNVYNSTTGPVWLKDAYGIKYAVSSISYTINADNVKPEVVKVEQTKAREVEVTFSKAVTTATAQNQFNYTVKNPDDSTRAITSATMKAGSLDKVVTLLLTDNPPKAGTWNIEIAGIRSVSGNNLMDGYKSTFVLGDKTGPTVSSVTYSGQNIYVTYSKNVDSTTATTAANYQFKGSELPAGTSLSMITGAVVKIVIPVTTTVTGGDAFAVSGNVMDTVGNKMLNFGYVAPAGIVAQTNNLALDATRTRNVRVIDRRTVEFRMEKELSAIDVANFTVNVGGTPIPSFVNSDGKATVKLTWATDVFAYDAAGVTLAVNAYNAGAGTGLTKATDGTYIGGAVGPAAVNDYIKPELTSTTDNIVRAVDGNGNGYIDSVVVEFTEDMNPAQFSTNSFAVAGYTVLGVKTDSSATFDGITYGTYGDGLPGKFVVIRVSEKTVADLTATPAVTFNGTMKDNSTNGNEFALPEGAKVAVAAASNATANVALALTTPAPGVGNTIALGADNRTVTVNVVNATASVVITGTKTAGQAVAIAGADSADVAAGGTATAPTYTVDTSAVAAGGSKVFTLTVSEAGKISIVYSVTVTVAIP